MKKIGVKTLAILIGFLVISANPFIRFTQAANQPAPQPDDYAKIERELSDSLKRKLKQGTYFVLGIELRIKNYHEELKSLRSNTDVLRGKIEESKVNVLNLQSQMENLGSLISLNEAKINAGELQIANLNTKIYALEADIKQLETNLGEQVGSLNDAMTSYYLQTNLFFSDNGNRPSLLAFLSADESTGKVLQENEYLFLLQKASEGIAEQITETQKKLDSKKADLEDKGNKIAALQMFLASEKQTLEAAKQSKKRLLEETKGKQMIYETLLSLSKKEEEQVSVAIERLKENYDFFQEKLNELKNNPNAAELMLDNLSLDDMEEILKSDKTFAWPVDPSLGLSALFHDESYKKAIGIEHNAIDIRISQGSKVKAAGDGVITKVADNGFAYSYVIIAHQDKMLTLYGHLSEILVTEGEIVKQGQTIGLSGGIPGTKGAGWLTTGAHLHFEVFKDFTHVDPLEYLPLEFVPVTSLPEKYVKQLTGEEASKKVRRVPLSLEDTAKQY
ncbi:peptidoglycan DD-metalloendopeptidase family protein [Candidatus Peregrinibacteria bacterium]|nr:peptidoglycan DD-metalloendopeptidase family protein [Candidatus Peregrinibacteria bacterium]